MPPSLPEIGIEIEAVPVYIHKIDRPVFWNSDDDLEQRVNNAVAKIFKDPESIYSFWRVQSDFDFYCIAASLSAGRSSPSEEISFLWVKSEELEALGLVLQQSEEGRCLYARRLHYDVSINPAQARSFCFMLMRAERKACRCRKKQMQTVVDCLTQKGCQAYAEAPDLCSCMALLT
ncbi:MAG: hypothetical protein HC895_13575 [Leptolyngbyaceae cyanobacterium SM1_3_5]|nr:hypothetical protein [Leptolyngbyaceae cyanobacterium SM1_3_5]